MMKLTTCFICFLLLLNLPLLSQESGQLSNGLEYDLMHNENPQGRASLWLVVKVGMLHEKEDQKGFAHLIEHSAWDRTEHINDQQLEEIFDLLGMAGSSDCVISMTGVDSTVFRLSIDLAHPQAIDKALFLLKEVSTSASLLPEDIENQRKEVIEEILAEMADPMRQKLEKELEILLDRPPKLFSQELIRDTQNASASEFQDFYHLHYRPDHMALIAVGDFDEKAVKSKIEGLFGFLVNPSAIPLEEKSVERPTRELPAQVSFFFSSTRVSGYPRSRSPTFYLKT